MEAGVDDRHFGVALGPGADVQQLSAGGAATVVAEADEYADVLKVVTGGGFENGVETAAAFVALGAVPAGFGAVREDP